MEEFFNTYAVLILTALTSILGWIANTLSGLRKDLNKKVNKYDCDRNMDYHCARLSKLEEDVKVNTNDIVGIKAHIGEH